MFRRAIELDPKFASAYGMAARCYSARKGSGWVSDRAQEVAEAARLARRAAELGKDDAVALAAAGGSLVYVVGDPDEGSALIDRALALNPNFATAWLSSAWAHIWLGEPEVALERLARAIRLSPQDPQTFGMQTIAACAHFLAGRYAEAASWAEKALREQNNYLIAISILAASYALAGRAADARSAMTKIRRRDPALRIADLKEAFPIYRPEHLVRFAEGLRQAGLPE